MTDFICITCGTQYPPSETPPPACPICDDPRQYVPPEGQRWTTQAELAADHHNEIRDDGGLVGISTEPSFAIGQRALLVPFGDGNLLWDCVTLLDDATAAEVERGGGHFPGGTMLHRAAGDGALLTGDIIQVIPDRTHVGFMWSYPNLVPLPDAEVQRIAAAVEPFAFEAIYGAWWGRLIPSEAKAVVRRSAARYTRAPARGVWA